MSKQRVANIFAYASLACTIWVGFGLSLYRLPESSHFPGLLFWLMIEVVGFLLAIVATVLRPKLWWITLLVPILMVVFLGYVMGT